MTDRSSRREVGVVGGAAVPHAPQFFTLPPTEDKATVERIEQLMSGIGEQLRALEPDVVLIVANDHLENFLLHCVPSFTVHRGPRVTGSFAGRDFDWPVDSDAATELIRQLHAQGFDPAASVSATIGYEFGIPLSFLGFGSDTPLIPVYVNSYVPPQPSSDRCYAFGQAIHRGLAAAGLRAVVIASGGLSHYPGTDRYSDPDMATDTALVERIRQGHLRALLEFDDRGLDEAGNVEARSWQILAGALGERVPDVASLDPSWHHNYATMGWYSPDPRHPVGEAALHYPLVAPHLVALCQALYDLRMDVGAQQRFAADPASYADQYALQPAEREALQVLDEPALRGLGVHPLLAFLARLQVQLHTDWRPQVKQPEQPAPGPREARPAPSDVDERPLPAN